MEPFDDSAGEPRFPPLFDGEPCPEGADPFALAQQAARQGTDAGLIVHRIRPDHLSAALVLAPEVPLSDAAAMLLVAAVGFADAFGALAPSEVAAQLDWPGGFRINGGRCGGLRAAVPACADADIPDWLMIGLDMPFFAEGDDEPGRTPERTTLWEEGCAEIAPVELLESWARHTLVWLHDWTEDGLARVHAEWTGRAFAIGAAADFWLGGRQWRGEFVGLDEKGGMLLKSGGRTELLPLTMALEQDLC